jgi:hypothetical protein
LADYGLASSFSQYKLTPGYPPCNVVENKSGDYAKNWFWGYNVIGGSFTMLTSICSTCLNDRLNCNNDWSDGCEVSTKGEDINNCGACGNKCGDGQICDFGTCEDYNLPILDNLEIIPDCLEVINKYGYKEYFCHSNYFDEASSNFTINVTIASDDHNILDVCRNTNAIRIKFVHINSRNNVEDVSSTRERAECIVTRMKRLKEGFDYCTFRCNFTVDKPFFTKTKVRSYFYKYDGENLWNITEIRFYNGYNLIAKSDLDPENNLIRDDKQVRFIKDLPNTGCEILDASVDTVTCTGMPQPDGTKKCLLGDKVKVSVKMNAKCDALSIKKVKFDLSEGSDSGQEGMLPITGSVVEDGCYMELSTDPTDPREKLFCSPDGTDNNCSGLIYLHDVSPNCFNKKLNASYVEIYNIIHGSI